MSNRTVERWDIFELSLTGPAEGNPFVDVSLTATFSHQHRAIEVDGFYDGGTDYRVRFMPDTVGEWRYLTHSNVQELDGLSGTFACTPAQEGNHGPSASTRPSTSSTTMVRLTSLSERPAMHGTIRATRWRNRP